MYNTLKVTETGHSRIYAYGHNVRESISTFLFLFPFLMGKILGERPLTFMGKFFSLSVHM